MLEMRFPRYENPLELKIHLKSHDWQDSTSLGKSEILPKSFIMTQGNGSLMNSQVRWIKMIQKL